MLRPLPFVSTDFTAEMLDWIDIEEWECWLFCSHSSSMESCRTGGGILGLKTVRTVELCALRSWEWEYDLDFVIPGTVSVGEFE